MTKARTIACLLCGDGYVPNRSLTPQEAASLLTIDDLQLYCPSCAPRQQATLAEKRYLRRLQQQLLLAPLQREGTTRPQSLGRLVR